TRCAGRRLARATPGVGPCGRRALHVGAGGQGHPSGAGGGIRPMSEPSFAAVIVIHDSAPELAALLSSLERRVDPAPELVVVDTGSTDGGAELARERGAHVVELPHNPGFGAANNAGVARASAPVTALLNPDIELLDSGLLSLVATVRERNVLLVPRLIDAAAQALTFATRAAARRLLGDSGAREAAQLRAVLGARRGADPSDIYDGPRRAADG